MNIAKKILILIIILLFTYILWRLIGRRQLLLRLLESSESKEGFSIPIPSFNIFTTQESELATITKQNPPCLIQNINTESPIYNLPLKEWCIKSSYNTALTGRYVNLDMIKYVLSRGCRFIDFEIYSIKGLPHVAVSTDPNYITLDTVNSLTLDDCLATVVSNAFASPSPNISDPLFIHLRVKSKDSLIYKAIAKSIDYGLKSRLYEGKINKYTQLSQIMGRIIIVMDSEINPNYKTESQCTSSEKNCYDLKKYVNLESGSEDLFLQNYDEIMNNWSVPILVTSDKLHTDILNMRVILPTISSTNIKNPPIYNLITSYGCQIVPYRYYYKDSALKVYEALFDDNKSAFVSLANAIHYCKKKNEIAAI